MKKLRDHRPKSAARHDNRSFRAERSADADGNRRGDWFEQSHLWLYQTAPEQDRLERFRNAVAPDLFRSITSHQPDDQRADYGRRDHPGAEMMILKRWQYEPRRWKKTRFVRSVMSQSSAFATTADTAPTGIASATSTNIRESVRKSRSSERTSFCLSSSVPGPLVRTGAICEAHTVSQETRCYEQ